MSTIGRVLHACRPTHVFAVSCIIAVIGMAATPLARAQSSDTTTSADTAAKPDSAKPAASPQGICLTCGPGDNPPVVTITPTTETVGVATQTVTVDWCDDHALAASSRQITFNGVDVTAQFSYTDVTPTSCGDEAKSVGTITLLTGSNAFAAQIRDGAAQLTSVSVTYTFAPLVVVTPDSSPLTGYAKLADTAVFTVKNPTGTSATYTLSTTCPTGWACAAASSVSLAGGASAPENVVYTPTTSGATGTVILIATPTSSPSSPDQGSYKVTVPITVLVSPLVSTMLTTDNVPGVAGFAVGNSGPTSSSVTLGTQCTGTGVSGCSVPASVQVAAGTNQLVWVTFAAGDSNTLGTVKLTATGSDPGNVFSSTMNVSVKSPGVPCDTGKSIECGPGGDRTPPVIAIRPATLAQTSRVAPAIVDWCDDVELSTAPPVIALNGSEVTPAWPDSDGNTSYTCNGAGTAHSVGTLTLLPGGNTVFAWACDAVGNCNSTSTTYTYTVLDIATADSALVRRGAGSTFNQAFRITNIGKETYAFSLTGSCTGTGVTACSIVGQTADTLAPGGSRIDTVSYQTPSSAAGSTGTVSLVASPVLNPTWSHGGSISVHTVTAVVSAAATPDSVKVPIAATLSDAYDFWVRNTGNVRESFTLTLACSGVTKCVASPTSATLAPADSTRIHTTFTGGAVGSAGSVQLNATTGSVTDHGTILVQAQPKDQPVASLDSVFAPGRIERSLCVTVAVGTGGAADECGDLRLAVATSAVRTLGETRAPTLLYGSGDATAAAVVPVWVSFLPQATLPDSVTASILIGGVVRDHGKWVKAQWAAGAGRQIALAIDGRTLSGGPGGANDHSGVYAATLQVTAYDGATTIVDTLATTIPVVDRSQSAFGAGWWLAGLEKLYFPTDGTLTWVGGDGSLRTYTKDPVRTSVYRAPSLTRLDSLVKDAGGQFIRYLPNKLHVRFNTAGQHIATITRLGDSTVFAYNGSGQLSSITVAPVSAAKTYSFFYDASGLLDSVAAPLGGSTGTTRRTTKLVASGTTRQVQSVTLADGSLIQFTYDAAHVGRVLTSTDPRNTKTTFVYDSAGKVLSATIGMQGQGADLLTKITPSVSQGIRTTSAVDTAVVATRIDGPRTDVGDTTVIRVTPYGAPRRITDALGHITRLDHSNVTFPALVTHEHRLDAAASLAVYDTKGHLTAETDSTTYVDDAVGTRTYATTSYLWDTIWDQVTVIAPPLHDSTVMTYDATTGNRLTQRDAVGDTVHYGYNTSGRLVSVRNASHIAPDSLTYDALGNVASTITPLGYVSKDFRDATGRDTLVTTPIDTLQTMVTSSRTVYDLADRPTLTQSFGPAVTFALPTGTGTAPAETLTVATVYDSGGLVRRVTRTANPDSAKVGSLVTRMGYDPAGRKVVDTATDNATETYEYDADGHVIVHNTRNGGIVAWTYDALGQLMNRQIGSTITPAITFDPRFLAWAPQDFATQKSDVSIFTYDSAGRMLSADNPVAQIRRTYMPNGALLSDTLRIATWAQDSDYSRHVYVLSHNYDLDGRRVATRGVGGDSVAYDLAGRVTGIQDAGLLWFHYHYDALGRPDVVTYPNGAQLTNTYDVQNQLRRRHEIGPSPSDSLIHDDTLYYDARGKVLYSSGHTEIDYEGYSALGTLWASMRHNTTLGPSLRNDERYGADAMGNVAQRTVVRTTGGEDSTFSIYATGTGRLLAQHSLTSNDSTLYTTGGDRAITWSQPIHGAGGDESRYYYRDDGLLVAVDHRSCTTVRTCIPNGLLQPTSLTGAFEDYRYDALGRRVQVRTRMDSICEGASCNSSLMWVVWDGNEIAAEIRGAGGDGISVDSLEQGSGNGPFYGTVDYLNGPNMDEPLEIQGIQVYRTWRGLIDGGQCLTGECGTGTIDYPGLTYEAYLSLIPSTQSAPTSWHGTLFANGQDDGGLMYRRNRYYDPNTGQFTQEDPIGLSGGANLYGFAGGDPVNTIDPFGTDCPPGKAIALCVILSVYHSLKPGPVPNFPSQSTIRPAPATATKPNLKAPEGTGEMKELVKDAKDAYDRLMGGGGDEPAGQVLKKIFDAGQADGPAVIEKAATRSTRVLGGVAGLVLMELIDPSTLGGRCSAEARRHGCMDQ